MSTSRQPAPKTPTPSQDGTDTSQESSPVSVQSSAAVALGMSWQLLVVIVAPLVGGRYLDACLHTLPLYTVIGMSVGAVGTIVVIYHTVQQLNEIMKNSTKEQ